jgi:hypothetical protein
VQDALDQVEPAVDYGLRGLQAFGSVFSLFPTSTAGHAQFREIINAWKKTDSPRLALIRERCEKMHEITQDVGWLAEDALRKSRLVAYNEMYQKCGFGLTGRYPEPSLEERYENPPPLPAETTAELKAAFARYFNDLPEADELFDTLALWLGKFISFVQVALDVSLEVQGRINGLLGRTPPVRTFMGRDLATYVGLDKSVDSKDERVEVPFLVDDIARVLGVTIDITVDEVKITDGVREFVAAPREAVVDVPSPQ